LENKSRLLLLELLVIARKARFVVTDDGTRKVLVFRLVIDVEAAATTLTSNSRDDDDSVGNMMIILTIIVVERRRSIDDDDVWTMMGFVGEILRLYGV
jgi:hypothetical protein